MSFSTDETYVQTYQKYLKQKGSSEDLRKLTISQTAASTKVLKPALTDKDCKICRVLSKPGDLCRVLNQGLFHKYTSSQDYFYTRDINTLLSKKRKAFSVRYYDDLIFDECKERLKGYFKRKESVSLMSEIKQFYTKFKNFPRNFHTNFFHIINSNIRKHRRIEYMRVFNGANLDEDKQQDENDQADQKDNSKNGREAKEFHLMELLGDSFLKDNYKDISDVAIGGVKLDKPRDTARSIQEIEENFKALYKGSSNSASDPNSGVFSNALYNKNYMLYSRSDSQTAEDILKQIVNEFKEADVGSKASMTLAEKVLHQVANAAATNSKKQENRYSPTLKQRAGGAFEFSPLIQGTRKPNNPIVATMQTQPITRQQSSLSNANNTSTRGQSNPRNNSRTEADNTNILGKVNQSKVYEQRKSTDKDKFPVEQLNDIVINRNKILSTLYQFRSTRSKSGGLKSVGTSKTPSHKNGFPLGEPKSGDVYDSKYAQGQLIGNVNEKSEPVSPNRRASKEDSRPVGDMIVKVKPNLEISAYNTMKRSASQGLNGDFRELGSPMLSQISQSTQHKKASSVIKRRGTATPIKRGVNGASVQNYTLNNNSSINNMSNSHQETAVSPNHGKFINPLRASLGTTQQYYFRHQSPMDEKIQQISGVYQSEPTVNKINIRGMKHTSPNRTDNNYRANTLSLSGRQQNLLDLSQGVSSHGASQVLGHLNKTNPDPTKVKKIEKASMQAFAAKIIKRASLAPNQIITPVLELEEKEKRPRKVLELNESNYNTFKDLKLPSKEQTPVHIGVSSATTLNKFKVEVKKNTWSSYPLKAVSKDQNIRLTLKK